MPDKHDIQNDGWNEWAKYVLQTLEDLKKQHDDNDSKIEGIGKETLVAIGKLITKITVLETRMTQKAAMSGGVVGALTSLIVGLLIYFITRSHVQP